MNKTLHRKLTEKHLLAHTPIPAHLNGEDMSAMHRHELGIYSLVAKDLLQPRPEAVANILKLSRTI